MSFDIHWECYLLCATTQSLKVCGNSFHMAARLHATFILCSTRTFLHQIPILYTVEERTYSRYTASSPIILMDRLIGRIVNTLMTFFFRNGSFKHVLYLDIPNQSETVFITWKNRPPVYLWRLMSLKQSKKQICPG